MWVLRSLLSLPQLNHLIAHVPPLSLWRPMHGTSMLQEPPIGLTTPNTVVCSPAQWKCCSVLSSQNTPFEFLFQVWWWGDTGFCLLCYPRSLRRGRKHAYGPGSFSRVPLNFVSFFRGLQFPNLGVKLFRSKSLISYMDRTNNCYLMYRPHLRPIKSESLGIDPGICTLLKNLLRWFPGSWK